MKRTIFTAITAMLVLSTAISAQADTITTRAAKTATRAGHNTGGEA